MKGMLSIRALTRGYFTIRGKTAGKFSKEAAFLSLTEIFYSRLNMYRGNIDHDAIYSAITTSREDGMYYRHFMNKRKITVKGLAKMWGWSEKTVSKFIEPIIRGLINYYIVSNGGIHKPTYEEDYCI